MRRSAVVAGVGVALALLLTSLAAAPVGAQDRGGGAGVRDSGVVLAGVVRDTAGRPLVGAEVRTADGVALSEGDGTFVLAGVTGDTVPIVVRRIGYRPAEVLLAVDPGVRRVEVAVTLVPLVLELGTIVVEGKRLSTPLMRRGYYDRERLRLGRFVGPEQVERHHGTLSSLLQTVPGVTVRRDAQNRAVVLGRSGGRACALSVFVDGMPIRFAAELGLEALVEKRDVLAMEVYPRATQLPIDFMDAGPGSGGHCGALVIWTKPPGSDASGT